LNHIRIVAGIEIILVDVNVVTLHTS